ncbi:MAG TPA: hypothetical protein PKU95_02515 [Candidatus Dojkabacteria bacterium]|nr:hypothetical protein [Candidatus Dojkabacteria bacterium]
MKNKYLSIGLVTLAFAAAGLSYFTQPVEAYTEVGQVTTTAGEVKTKVDMKATILEIDGSMVKLKDNDTGTEYVTRFGPAWFVDKEYNVGDILELTGVLVDAEDNENGNTLLTMVVDGQTLRSNFPGKPDWAGKGGNGKGTGNGNGGDCINQ